MQLATSQHRATAWKLLAYFAAVLLGGAVLAPMLFAGGQWLLEIVRNPARQNPGALAWLESELSKAGFTRFFNRAVLIAALVAVWPLIRWVGIERSVLPKWSPFSSGLRHFVIGFCFAAVLLLLLGWAFCSAGVYKLRPDAPWLALGAPLFAAVSVGIVEEFFFRGALLGLLLRSMQTTAALIVGTLIFAIVHFLKPPEWFEIPNEQVGWHSGFQVLAAIFANFGNVDFLVAELLTLFAVGWILAQGRMVTGRLWVGIGLHAGWVFGLKYFSALTRASKELRDGEHLPWIGLNLKIGLVPLAVVLVTGWIVLRIARYRTKPDAPDESAALG